MYMYIDQCIDELSMSHDQDGRHGHIHHFALYLLTPSLLKSVLKIKVTNLLELLIFFSVGGGGRWLPVFPILITCKLGIRT